MPDGELPELVRGYLGRALPAGGDVPREVLVGQAGEMWLKPGGRAMPFTAVERFRVDRVAFSWRARFPILRLLSMRVVDRYAAGEGLLEARLLGVPVMRSSDRAAAEGEAMRYLAELPWVPHAMQANTELEWRDLGGRSVEVATSVGTSRVAVGLDFDAAGDIVRASAAGRPHPEGKLVVPRPWAGEFGSYEVVAGVHVPTRAEVRWELPDGPFTYWRGRVTSLELSPAHG